MGISLKEFGSGGHLELFDQIGHEPVGVGVSSEPEMAFTLNIDPGLVGLDLSDVGLSLLFGADMVIWGNEEGHG